MTLILFISTYTPGKKYWNKIFKWETLNYQKVCIFCLLADDQSSPFDKKAGIISVSQMPKQGLAQASIRNILLNQLINWLFGMQWFRMIFIFLKHTYFAKAQWSTWITMITKKRNTTANCCLVFTAINMFFYKNHKDDKYLKEPAWKTTDIIFIYCLLPKGDHSWEWGGGGVRMYWYWQSLEQSMSHLSLLPHSHLYCED